MLLSWRMNMLGPPWFRRARTAWRWWRTDEPMVWFHELLENMPKAAKLVKDTGGGCSICGARPCVNVHGSYWLCGPCVLERISDTTSETQS